MPAAGQPKGVVPKNTKDQKEGKDELSKPVDFEVDIVSGLVLLPDEERKEYLRVARESKIAPFYRPWFINPFQITPR